jgi:hypothetical protein
LGSILWAPARFLAKTQGLGERGFVDRLGFAEIRHGAGDSLDSSDGPSGEPKLVDGSGEQAVGPSGGGERAFELVIVEVGVPGPRPFPLFLASPLDARSDPSAGGSWERFAELVPVLPRNPDVEVDPVEQGTR